MSRNEAIAALLTKYPGMAHQRCYCLPGADFCEYAASVELKQIASDYPDARIGYYLPDTDDRDEADHFYTNVALFRGGSECVIWEARGDD